MTQAWRVEMLTPFGRTSPFQLESVEQAMASAWAFDELTETATDCRPGGIGGLAEPHSVPSGECTCGLYAATVRSSLATMLSVVEHNRDVMCHGHAGAEAAEVSRLTRFVVLGGILHDPMDALGPLGTAVAWVRMNRTVIPYREQIGYMRRSSRPPHFRVVQDPPSTVRGSRFEITSCAVELQPGDEPWEALLPPVDDLTIVREPLSKWVTR